METKLGPGGSKRSKGIVDTETGEDKETTEVMSPAEAIINQNIVHNHTEKGAKAADIEARDLVGLHLPGQQCWGQQHPWAS